MLEMVERRTRVTQGLLARGLSDQNQVITFENELHKLNLFSEK